MLFSHDGVKREELEFFIYFLNMLLKLLYINEEVGPLLFYLFLVILHAALVL